MNNKIIKKEIEFAGKKITLETGKLAPMSNLAVKASYGDTVMLITANSGGYNPELDFFPLMVNYNEKLYASGTIKSSRFVKRDGRSTDDAIITGRLCDHAIRPLFPSDFSDETQIVGSVMSLEEDADATFLFLNAVSATLQASTIPWNGPMLTARVGYINNDYVLNPTRHQLHDESTLDMTVSFVGKEMKFLAIEAEANVLPENVILGAIEFARNGLKPIYDLIEDFAKAVNPKHEKFGYESVALEEDLTKDVHAIAKEKVIKLMQSGLDKVEMSTKLSELFEEVYTSLEGKYKKARIEKAFYDIEKHALQQMILDQGKRPDGRAIDEVRPITVDIDVLPRVHGSGLFTRGVTQVMTIATLGSPSDEMLVQDMYGEVSKKYMHFYNFPPYASGEIGRVGGFPKNREIGHGMLAEKALKPVLPDTKDFPYTIVLVSETLSSSGSTSMAATCGSTLALMAAGVPIKDMVAGIGVGLIVNDDMSKQLIMTDLAYMEDAFGFLDFKMTGTRNGVTAIQCDMKAEGIPMDLLPKIFEQSKAGRLHVLDKMEEVIKEPRKEVSEYAPKSAMTKIDPDKIGMVIGPGGKVIKELQERTSTDISIEEDGTVVATGFSPEGVAEAIAHIDGMTKDVEVGEIYDGVVKEIVDFGAFVQILPGKDGLLHVSEISSEYVDDVRNVLSEGQEVRVKVIKTEDGKVSLSKRAIDDPEGYEKAASRPSNRGGNNRRGGRFNDRKGRNNRR
ncbi:MAG: polyribonucleotide nucleotidyltransferase [Patescibacteria group bacterium]